jgi:hypothetical protein
LIHDKETLEQEKSYAVQKEKEEKNYLSKLLKVGLYILQGGGS